VNVLCLAELDTTGTVASVSLQALALARRLAADSPAGELAAVVFRAEDRLPLDALGAAGVTHVHAVPHGQLDGYAPRAWASVLGEVSSQVGASAVVAGATDRGNEVMAHLGAITGKPVAANCLSAQRTAEGAHQLVRQRWGGLLLEDAVLETSPALLTVAADALQGEPDAPPARSRPAVRSRQ